jgi:RNA polymerase sigma factor (sigma-70 family)
MLQEALVILWERVRASRFTVSARLQTFVVATVKNLWYRRLARARRETPLDPEYETPEPCSPLDELVESEEGAILAAALGRIGDPCKTLLMLFYWEELTMEDIARKMGFANADTAKAKKYQCKKALEQAVREGGVRS